ncbi:FliA/WhiG family RNA polymerase sigma factor [Clostridium niameyense]|uniref:RNA polymerase sigma factor n=1 Tax=Clostridium niameyense TaxID=1622073 RepID=A0A6M0R8J6_9CLOT|nr:FliA/WhiG family RNA polymerase sigma factor [Clostridium niameyense]NEZ45909.1 FliA/WhiG family RNA polymerase sigma factor [Clostridium niameyense]
MVALPSGDDKLDVREEVVKKYIPLVKYIASRVIIGKTKYIEYEDLVSYGMIGLMDALNKFDVSKGMKFSTYASIRIKGSMIDELRRNSPISKGAMDKLTRYNHAVEQLQKNFKREPKMLEVAEYLNITLKEVSDIENYINYISVVSLEDLIFSQEDEVPLIGTIEDQKSPSPEKYVEEQEKLEYLTKAIDMLNEKDRLVLTLYYYEELTLKEIGKILGVSESRVCQLHSRAIVHLKKSMEKLKYSAKI